MYRFYSQVRYCHTVYFRDEHTTYTTTRVTSHTKSFAETELELWTGILNIQQCSEQLTNLVGGGTADFITNTKLVDTTYRFK